VSNLRNNAGVPSRLGVVVLCAAAAAKTCRGQRGGKEDAARHYEPLLRVAVGVVGSNVFGAGWV
jgi:hypothetical protein